MSNSSIIDGKLVRASPSSINKFDSSTTWGCERKWWFRYVAGLDEPTTGNQSLGTEVHWVLEYALSPKDFQHLGLKPVSDAAIELANEASSFITEISPKVLHVEEAFTTSIAGVLVTGFCDVVTNDGIIDWKTSSNIRKYAKTEDELKRDTQMLIYANAFHPELSEVNITHGNFDTGKKLFEPRTVTITQREIKEHIVGYVTPLLNSMKLAVAVDVTALPKCPDKCFMCPFRAPCEEADTRKTMSLFNRMQVRVETTEEKAAEKQSMAETTDSIISVLPPDAPKSDPALASDPLITPDARGRKTRKKKDAPPPVPLAKDPNEEAPALTEKQQATIQIGEALSKFAFESVLISRGATVNLGNYNSTKIDIAASARFEGDPTEAYKKVDEFVKQKVAEWVESVLPSVQEDKRK